MEPETEALWDEFHRVVNMSSRELSEWLRTRAAAQEDEDYPDQAGSEFSRNVLAILGKRKTDLIDDDVDVMRRVVDQVYDRRSTEIETTAGDTAWRHDLMSIGHDPLKPTPP